MARYFMHLRDGSDGLLDPDGIEMPVDAIADRTLACARDCMAGDVAEGRLDLRYHIDVHDEDDKVVHTLSFADAIEIIAPK